MMEFFWRRLRRGDRGFTLIELLIVVAIIAILAAILIPNFLRARAQSQLSSSKGNMKNIGTALEAYFIDNNAYPGPDATAMATALVSKYMGAVPKDPCSTTAYTYAAAATNATTYTLSITFSATVGKPCFDLGVTTLTYTPSSGLSQSP